MQEDQLRDFCLPSGKRGNWFGQDGDGGEGEMFRRQIQLDLMIAGLWGVEGKNSVKVE